jgi:MtN3 and saliva related transmembrane protein
MSGEWMGYVAATLTTAAFVPQAVKTLRSRDTRAISLGMYVVFTVGLCFWLAYGIVLDSWPMILSNIITLALALLILGLKLRHG